MPLGPIVAPSRGPTGRRSLRITRALSWAALALVTGWMVRAEVAEPGLPEDVLAYRALAYRPDGTRRHRLDVYLPAAPAPPGGRPAVVAIHGGGWRGGSRGEFGREVARFARHGLAVVAIDYTLSRPGAPSWPANRDDVRQAVRWVRRHAGALGIDPGRIAALGASAGGHLAALLGADPGDPKARVQAVVDLYGPSDLHALGGACAAPGGPIDLLLGGLPADRPGPAADASPVRHVDAGTPPMLLIHGADDQLVPPEQSRRLATALERAGVPHRLIVLDGAAHAFGLTVGPRDLMPEVLAFLDGAWNDEDEAR